MILGVLATLSAAASDPLLAGDVEDVGVPDIDRDQLEIVIAPPGTDTRGIVNGTNAGPNDYPEVCAIYSGAYGGQFCSGTLIHPEWVLTAGHCVEGAIQILINQGRVEVRFGNDASSSAQAYDVVDGFVHPQYASSAYSITNDVALLHLARSVQGIDPTVLNDEPPNNSWLGTEMTFVGFGTTHDSGVGSGRKRYTDIEVDYYDSQVIVSFDRDDSDGHQNVCYGDSGGSAFENEASGRELAGVNSYVSWYDPDTSCIEGGNGVARVDQHIGWISGYVPKLRLSPDDPPQTGGTTTEPPEPVDTGLEVDDIEHDYDEWNAPQRPVKGLYSACSTGPGPGGLGASLLVGLLLVAYRPRPR